MGLRTAGSGLHEQLYEGYSAPEQYSTAEFEGRYTDEYSLAAVFYRMVCGQALLPAAQRVVSDSNPRARTVERCRCRPTSRMCCSWACGSRPWSASRLCRSCIRHFLPRNIPQELTRTMKPEPRAEPAGAGTEGASAQLKPAGGHPDPAVHSDLLTLWGMVSQGSHQPAASSGGSGTGQQRGDGAGILVPSFIGMDYAQVQNNREYTGMYLFYVTEEYSDTAPAGQIIQQEPSADTVLKAGETIRLVVSKGPQMAEMPNIIGFTQDGAVKELEARGLVASCFMVVNDGSYASGCVVRASEEPGTRWKWAR